MKESRQSWLTVGWQSAKLSILPMAQGYNVYVIRLVPNLHSQLFFACCKKKAAFFTTCKKKLGVETGTEASKSCVSVHVVTVGCL